MVLLPSFATLLCVASTASLVSAGHAKGGFHRARRQWNSVEANTGNAANSTEAWIAPTVSFFLYAQRAVDLTRSLQTTSSVKKVETTSTSTWSPPAEVHILFESAEHQAYDSSRLRKPALPLGSKTLLQPKRRPAAPKPGRRLARLRRFVQLLDASSHA